MATVSVILNARAADRAATLSPTGSSELRDDTLTPGYEAAVRSLAGQDPEELELLLPGSSAAFAKTIEEALGDGWQDRVHAVDLPDPEPGKVTGSNHKGAPAPVPGVARARNAGVAASDARYIAFLVPADEWERGHLALHVSTLENDSSIGASYGRYTVRRDDGTLKTRPSTGAQGDIFEPLIQQRQLFYTPSVVMARREALSRTPPASSGSSHRILRGPVDETLDGVGVLDLLLRLSRDWKIAFVEEAAPVLTPANRPHDGIIERRIRIFIGLLYGPQKLEEDVEHLVRGRLAHELTALGKLYYGREDYDRAGRFFREAAKASPGYFKGRRYQFVNYVREMLSSSPDDLPSED